MRELFRIKVSGDIALTSPNRLAGKHPMIIHKLRKKAKENARYAWYGAKRPVAPGRVRVSVVIRRATPFDEDNAWGAVKGHLDGLFKKGITPDDKPKYLELGRVTQEISPRFKFKEEVEFVIEDAGPVVRRGRV